MKKTIFLILALLVATSFTACSSGNPNNNSNPTPTHSSSSSSKIKLLGDIIPLPKMNYDVINASDEYVYLEVENASENDFRSYVESCKPYGFDGYILSATVPEFYFREYNSDGYFIEVRFENQGFSVFVEKRENNN